jgi:LPXTG-motif cell wall-anchored protein
MKPAILPWLGLFVLIGMVFLVLRKGRSESGEVAK